MNRNYIKTNTYSAFENVVFFMHVRRKQTTEKHDNAHIIINKDVIADLNRSETLHIRPIRT